MPRQRMTTLHSANNERRLFYRVLVFIALAQAIFSFRCEADDRQGNPHVGKIDFAQDNVEAPARRLGRDKKRKETSTPWEKFSSFFSRKERRSPVRQNQIVKLESVRRSSVEGNRRVVFERLPQISRTGPSKSTYLQGRNKSLSSENLLKVTESSDEEIATDVLDNAIDSLRIPKESEAAGETRELVLINLDTRMPLTKPEARVVLSKLYGAYEPTIEKHAESIECSAAPIKPDSPWTGLCCHRRQDDDDDTVTYFSVRGRDAPAIWKLKVPDGRHVGFVFRDPDSLKYSEANVGVGTLRLTKALFQIASQSGKVGTSSYGNSP